MAPKLPCAYQRGYGPPSKFICLGPFLSSVLVLLTPSSQRSTQPHQFWNYDRNSIIFLTHRAFFSLPATATFFECISNTTSCCGQSDKAQESLLRPTHKALSSYHHIFNMSSNDMTPVPVHTEADFTEVKTGTNKCDFCEKNRCVGKGKPARHMRRCNKCSRHVCEPCAEKRGWTHSLSWAR